MDAFSVLSFLLARTAFVFMLLFVLLSGAVITSFVAPWMLGAGLATWALRWVLRDAVALR